MLKEPKPGSFDYLLGPIRPRTRVDPPVVPPAPPPGEPERSRVVINIEIGPQVHPGRATRRRSWAGTLMWVVVLLGVLALLGGAHAQSMRYEHWQDTSGWHGEARTQGGTTQWDAYGPHGQQKHCDTYHVGDQPQTACH